MARIKRILLSALVLLAVATGAVRAETPVNPLVPDQLLPFGSRSFHNAAGLVVLDPTDCPVWVDGVGTLGGTFTVTPGPFAEYEVLVLFAPGLGRAPETTFALINADVPFGTFVSIQDGASGAWVQTDCTLTTDWVIGAVYQAIAWRPVD